LVGGIEGGGTRSNVTLIDAETSRVLATVHSDLPTNLYHIGIDQTCHRCNDLVEKAMVEAGIEPKTTKLKALGLSLSGCEVQETMQQLKARLLELHPDLTEECTVASDTVGTLLTASGDGGMVVIAGTGSNALLQNPETPDATERCGGWGHMIGDEGSAFKVAQSAIKYMFDLEDNMPGRQPPHDMTKVKAAILEHFDIKDRFGLLTHYYDSFTKPKFAGLCAKIAALAKEGEGGDAMAKFLLEENGRWLARHIVALIPKMSASVLAHLRVACVGSVWKSWQFMESGFHQVLREAAAAASNENARLKRVTLLKLKVPMSVGACYMAAAKAKIDIQTTYQDNCEVFCDTEY